MGKLELPNVFRTEGGCFYSTMQFSTCLYHLWEPFSLLIFIADEFCSIWLCDEVLVNWSVFWSKVPLQFHVRNHGLVTVAWYSSKICLFCTVGNEEDLYDSYESACMMSLLCCLKKSDVVFLWSCCHEHCMYQQHDRDCSMEWCSMCGVTNFAKVWKHNLCCNDVHTSSSPEVCSLI